MDATLFRITLWRADKRPLLLSRSVSEECLNSVVLCACQWLVWSHSAGRGKMVKYQGYRVYQRGESGSWHEVAAGTLKDARSVWTNEDEARIESMPDVRPLIGVRGTTRHGKVRTLRGVSKPQSRLAQLVREMQQRK